MAPVDWQHQPHADDLLIPGVNYLLGNGSGNQDFSPGGFFDVFVEIDPFDPFTKHVISTANVVPEPSTLVLAGVGAFSVLGYRYRGRRKVA